MAISKIWPLYQTIGKAVKYICNYEKTEDGTLITSYKCTERFADHEFEDIAAKARKVPKPRIGYHATISFSPDDCIEPKKALELGKQIIDEYTGGKYQYVLSVHTDQEHIHVHCILNSVNFQDYKKFHIHDKDLNKLELLTDKVCRENNLSVIEEKSGTKGRGKYEYEKHLNGDSWKDKLREIIDKNILLAENYEDFIERMQMEDGCEIKQGKYLSFRLPGQERFTRNRKLGDFYSIDSIKERIMNKEKILPEHEQKEQQSEKFSEHTNASEQVFLAEGNISFDGNVKKIIDVDKNEKAKQYTAYRKKLSLININSYAGMMNFVRKYHIVYQEDFDRAKAELTSRNGVLTEEIRNLYSELNSLEADAKQFQKYLDNVEAHQRYITTSDKDEKFDLSEANKNFESALIYIKRNEIKLSKVTRKNLVQKLKRIDELKIQIEKLKEERNNTRSDIKQLDIIQKNNKKLFGEELSRTAGPEKEQGKEQNQR